MSPSTTGIVPGFLSTPSGWRATYGGAQIVAADRISIHALRVEGDVGDGGSVEVKVTDFYPRPPGGGRLSQKRCTSLKLGFLSTPSGWRATTTSSTLGKQPLFLSTPSGWRATPRNVIRSYTVRFLSTPSGWRATFSLPVYLNHRKEVFLSTPSGWRATDTGLPRGCPPEFLSTPSGWRATIANNPNCIFGANFYPRPPGGGRPFACSLKHSQFPFLSTPSGWRATDSFDSAADLPVISIHALRVEGD